MKVLLSVKTTYSALSAHWSRSFLTILGIIIGISALMLISSLGKGAQNLILSQIQTLGSKTIAVVPGREPKGPTDHAVVESFYGNSLKERELASLQKKSNVPKVSDVMPLVFGIETASRDKETFRPMVIGASHLISKIFNLVPQTGTFFTDDDVAGRSSAAIIGIKVKEELFGESDALGEKIKINDRNYRIVGVLPKKGQVLFFNFDEAVIVPYTTAQTYIFGIKYFHRIIVQTETEDDVPFAVRDIEATLRSLHGITDPEDDDFFVGTQAEISETFTTVTDILTVFLAAVSAISLVVGGIGIMNIMLVSVTERTSEVGLRKALGATEKNILFQFLLESFTLTTAGGIAGIIMGTVFSFASATIITSLTDLDWKFAFPMTAALVGIIISGAIGLLFGIYPAWKASRKNPIEALGYE